MQQTNFFTRSYRIGRIVIHTLVGLGIAAFVLPFTGKRNTLGLIQWWCGGLLRAFNIKVLTFGDTPKPNMQGVMFVANHVSWADIHALNSLIPLRFVAKSDIKNWPVFGYLVEKANTLFIERSKRQAAGRIVDTVCASLVAGDNICYFPEGTTTDGTQILPFKSSVLQAAINANTQVWPVAIRYSHDDGRINTHMAYAGETSLIESMQQVLAQANPRVEMHFLPLIDAHNQNRRDLTQAAHQAIATCLGKA